MAEPAPPRLRESSLQLLRRAVGQPSRWRDKLARLAAALRGWTDARAVDRRLRHLHALGRLEAPLPTPIQRMVGAAASPPLRHLLTVRTFPAHLVNVQT